MQFHHPKYNLPAKISVIAKQYLLMRPLLLSLFGASASSCFGGVINKETGPLHISFTTTNINVTQGC
jgi:hypothetical protein